MVRVRVRVRVRAGDPSSTCGGCDAAGRVRVGIRVSL